MFDDILGMDHFHFGQVAEFLCNTPGGEALPISDGKGGLVTDAVKEAIITYQW